MIKKCFISFVGCCFSLVVGCLSPTTTNTYVEGTSLTVGLWLPVNGQIYGLQAVNYLSGKKISVNTNTTFKIDSEREIKNKSFGVVDVMDNSKTKIGKWGLNNDWGKNRRVVIWN